MSLTLRGFTTKYATRSSPSSLWASRALPRVEALLAVILTGLAAYLGLRFATEAGPLWRDEVSTVHLATLPRFADVLGALHLDSAPALYPTLLRLWSSPGWPDPDSAFRFSGFLVALAAAGAVWAAARTLAVQAPLLGVMLFCLHPSVIQTLGTLKPYGAGAVFVVLAFGAIWRLASAPGPRAMLWAVAASVLAVQTLYHSALLILALCLAAAAVKASVRDWRGVLCVAAPGLAAAASLVPYVRVIVRSQDWRPLSQIEPGTGHYLVRLLNIFSFWNPWLVALWLAAGALALLAAAYTLLRSGSRWAQADQGRLVYVLATMVGSTGLLLGFLASAGRNAEAWHLVPLLALVALGLDVILSPSLRLRLARLAVVGCAIVVMVPLSARWTGVRQTNVDVMATYLEQSARPGDLIVVNPWFVGITFARYYRGGVPWVTIPPMEDLRIHRYDLLKRRMAEPAPLAPLRQAILTTLEGGHRLWLVHFPWLMKFPAEGDVPAPLPPAPGAPSGWRDSPYGLAWSREIEHLVQTHALRSEVVAVKVGRPVWWAESVALRRAEGRRGP